MFLACRALGEAAIHSRLGFERALAGLVFRGFLHEPLLLLLQPARVIALIGNALAAIELENPARHIVEEVAVVGDDQDRARIVAQMAFEPIDGLGVEMVRRLVQQQEVGLLEEQPAERHAAPLAARELRHVGIVGRTAERLHGLIDLAVEVPEVLGLDLVLQPRHLIGGLVGIVHGQIVVAIEEILLLLDAEHDIAAHVELRVELRLLRQIADARAFGDEALADELLVDARHDAQKRRFARAVDAEHADLGVRVEGEIDVVQDLLAAGPGLGEALHVIDELTRHRVRVPPLREC